MVNHDERGIKLKNKRKSIYYVQKWENNNFWAEIVEEGDIKSKGNMEAVNLIHVPDTVPIGQKDPEQPPGYESLNQ